MITRILEEELLQVAELYSSVAHKLGLTPKRVGDYWWVVSGDVRGIGETPKQAMLAFDAAWDTKEGVYDCTPKEVGHTDDSSKDGKA